MSVTEQRKKEGKFRFSQKRKKKDEPIGDFSQHGPLNCKLCSQVKDFDVIVL